MNKIFNIRVFKVLINLGIVVAVVGFAFSIFTSYIFFRTTPSQSERKEGNLTIKSSTTSSLQLNVVTTRFSIPPDIKFSDNHKTYIPKELTGKFGIYLNEGDSQNPLAVLSFIYILLVFVIVTAILVYLKKIVVNVENGQIFTEKNIKRLNVLGTLSLVYPIYKLIEQRVLSHLLLSLINLPEGFKLDIKSQNEVIVTCVIIAFVFFTMASIFQYGKKLKEDQEFTI